MNISNLDIILPERLGKIETNAIKSLDFDLNNDLPTAGACSLTENNQKKSEAQNSIEFDENSETQEVIIIQASAEQIRNFDNTQNIQTDQLNGGASFSGTSQNSNLNQAQKSASVKIANSHNLPLIEMALTPGDLLNGIPDFDPKSQDSVKMFVAKVDLMNTLASNMVETILTIARAKLITANKLSSVNDKTWTQIKTDIQTKYRTQISFEVAQEKLLSLQQGQKETHEAYANRVRSLLDALNNATVNDNADIQNSNRSLNESLAIRKYKQNIFDRELRGIALSVDHTNLSDAIAHATSKYEQLNASNVVHQPQAEKKDSSCNASNKNSNGNASANHQNKQSHGRFNKNKQEYNKNKTGAPQCTHCKKTNHTSDQCWFRPGGPGINKNNNNEQSQTKSSNTAAAVPQPSTQSEPLATTSSVAQTQQQMQTMTLQPYHFLGN